MNDQTIKMIAPLARKAGMSREAFREYYENHHRLIGEKYLKGFVSKYMRRYVSPTIADSEPAFDVLLEMWFPDAESFKACMQRLRSPEVAAEIKADEEKLFDRSKMNSYLVDEVESTF